MIFGIREALIAMFDSMSLTLENEKDDEDSFFIKSLASGKRRVVITITCEGADDRGVATLNARVVSKKAKKGKAEDEGNKDS